MDETQKTNININSPKALKGLDITCEKEKFLVKYNELSLTYTPDEIPKEAFFNLAYTALTQIQNFDSASFEKQDEKYVATVSAYDNTVKIELNEDFFISLVAIEEYGFYLTLTKHKNTAE